MKYNLLFLLAALTACEEGENLESLSSGKEPLDVNAQIDLDTITPADLYDRKIIVRRKSSIKASEKSKIDLKLLEKDDVLDVEIFEVPAGTDVIEYVEKLRATGDFEVVEPNLKVGLNPPPTSDEDGFEENGVVIKNPAEPLDPTPSNNQ